MKTTAKIWHSLGFASTLIGYGLYPYLWDGAFYHLTAFAFVCLNMVIFQLLKGQWRLVSLVMLITSINNLFDELFFNPLILDYNEYITLLVTIIIVYKQRKKWMEK